MVRYLTLVTFTDSGIREVAKSPKRAATFCSAVEAAGGRVLGQYWALGEFDGCVILEAPDDATAASLLLDLGREDHVRTRSMRIFDATEFEKITKAIAS